METRFTRLVGCRLPLQLAVLGGVGTAELAAAVAGSGGLGMIPDGEPPPVDAEGPVGIGFLIPFVPPHEIVTERARGLRLVEFFFGDPDAALVRAGHDAGALVSWQVGSVGEARAARDAGCDLLVAQGVEAGGHVRGTQPLDALLDQVLSVVDVPVVAAGGIGTAARVADLLEAGADAVRIGTRFLATPESAAHPDYVRALVKADAADAVLTEHFDEGGVWPAAVRVLSESLERSRAAGNRSVTPPRRDTADVALAMACYAGLSVAHVHDVVPAREVVLELTALLS